MSNELFQSIIDVLGDARHLAQTTAESYANGMYALKARYEALADRCFKAQQALQAQIEPVEVTEEAVEAKPAKRK